MPLTSLYRPNRGVYRNGRKLSLPRPNRLSVRYRSPARDPLALGVMLISVYESKRKEKLRIWEVSTGLLVKERGETKITCIDNSKMITIMLMSISLQKYITSTIFPFDKITLRLP